MAANDQGYLMGEGHSVPFTLNKLTQESSSQTRIRKKIGDYIVELYFERNIIGRKVGRADQPLKDRLGLYLDSKYIRFRYKFVASKAAAFKQECRDYNRFDGRSDNEIHPDRPNSTTLFCPHVDCRVRQIQEIADSIEPLLGDWSNHRQCGAAGRE